MLLSHIYYIRINKRTSGFNVWPCVSVVRVLQAGAGQAAVHDVREPPLHPGTVATRVTFTLEAAHSVPTKSLETELHKLFSSMLL